MGIEILLRICSPLLTDSNNIILDIVDSTTCRLINNSNRDKEKIVEEKENEKERERERIITSKNKIYKYNYIFDINVTQYYIYNYFKPLIKSTFEKGGNTCIILNGEENKTYTYIGINKEMKNPDQRGLILRTCEELFTSLKEKFISPKQNIIYRISICLLLFTKDHIIDMISELNNKSSLVTVIEDNELNTMVIHSKRTKETKSIYVTVENMKDVYTLLHIYTTVTSRKKGSHSVFTICVDKKNDSIKNYASKVKTNKNKFIAFSRLHFVELSSQLPNVAAEYHHDPLFTYTKNNKLTQPEHISNIFKRNKDAKIDDNLKTNDNEFRSSKCNSYQENVFDAITSCFASIGKGKNSFIPHRNSRLTHYLQDALSFKGHCVLLTTINPTSDHYNSSLFSLRFASRIYNATNSMIHSFTRSGSRSFLTVSEMLRTFRDNEEDDDYEPPSAFKYAIKKIASNPSINNNETNQVYITDKLKNASIEQIDNTIELIDSQSEKLISEIASLRSSPVTEVKHSARNLEIDDLIYETARKLPHKSSTSELSSVFKDDTNKIDRSQSEIHKSNLNSTSNSIINSANNSTTINSTSIESNIQKTNLHKQFVEESNFIPQPDRINLTVDGRDERWDVVLKTTELMKDLEKFVFNMKITVPLNQEQTETMDTLFNKTNYLANFSVKLANVPYTSVGSLQDWESVLSSNVNLNKNLVDLRENSHCHHGKTEYELEVALHEKELELSKANYEISLWKREYFRFTSRFLDANELFLDSMHQSIRNEQFYPDEIEGRLNERNIPALEKLNHASNNSSPISNNCSFEFSRSSSLINNYNNNSGYNTSPAPLKHIPMNLNDNKPNRFSTSNTIKKSNLNLYAISNMDENDLLNLSNFQSPLPAKQNNISRSQIDFNAEDFENTSILVDLSVHDLEFESKYSKQASVLKKSNSPRTINRNSSQKSIESKSKIKCHPPVNKESYLSPVMTNYRYSVDEDSISLSKVDFDTEVCNTKAIQNELETNEFVDQNENNIIYGRFTTFLKQANQNNKQNLQYNQIINHPHKPLDLSIAVPFKKNKLTK